MNFLIFLDHCSLWTFCNVSFIYSFYVYTYFYELFESKVLISFRIIWIFSNTTTELSKPENLK
jgi:hypothetical protein